jgi:hypothetical protein
MQRLPSYLRYAGIAVSILAVIVALSAMETQAAATSRMNPESAIALAIVAFGLFRASELRWNDGA